VSVRQGDMISSVLGEAHRRWNGALGGGPVAVADDKLRVVELPGGLRITILSPTLKRLAALAPQWDEASRKAGVVPGVSAPQVGNRLAEPTYSESSAVELEQAEKSTEESGNDVSAERWTDFTTIDLEALAGRPFRGDASIANGSSIAMLIEFEGRSLLVGGDAFAPDLVRSVRALIARRSMKRLGVDAFVVPHNGSRHNTSKELLRLLWCSTYLVSTSGQRFHHPDDETIARILTYGRPRPDEPLTLIFNYRSHTTLKWSSPQLQAKFGYRAIYPDSGAGMRVDFFGSEKHLEPGRKQQDETLSASEATGDITPEPETPS
jgi:hypothetical protein